MEPITAGLAATLVVTGFFTGIGKGVSDKAIEQGGKLVKLLGTKLPAIANKIEAAKQKPLDYGEAKLIGEEIEKAAEKDPEIRDSVQAVADEVSESQVTQIIENWKGINIKGGSPEIKDNTFNF